MPAAGGPTTQSGIHYQDALAALYLGRMCDPRERPLRDHVREVRVEAPAEVDDIEIVFAHGGRSWIQAKERIRVGSEEWVTAWQSFENRRFAADFGKEDRLVLWLGMTSTTHEAVAEAARRACYARDPEEWWNDLSSEQQTAVNAVQGLLSEVNRNHETLFALLAATAIEIAPTERLRRDFVPQWMPQCHETSSESLFDILVSKAASGARYRRIFTAAQLLQELREQGIRIVDVRPGVAAYRAAIGRLYGPMSIPGTSLVGMTKSSFLWPTLRVWERERPRVLLDDEYVQEAGDPVDPHALPEGARSRVVIVSGAGGGKSALLRALAHRHADSVWVPVLISLADLARSQRPIAAFLDEEVSTKFGISVDWTELAESGMLLLLLDGLDELSLRERTQVLEAVTTFSARFPDVPWILTARETGALAAPMGARILELQPLRDDQIEAFCSGWLPSGHEGKAQQIAIAIARSREVRRMARVPLLLCLMVDHAMTQFTPLPARRTELIERYIATLLRPDAHKPTTTLPDDLKLRSAAEQLAFAALERGGVEVSSRDAMRVLSESPAQLLSALKSCGVLREQVGAYSFVFPLIQEYLAGCYIQEHLPHEVVRRFSEDISRPWAQALVFAIEQSNDADALINRILELPDDAFQTTLMAVGRCVANGARVTPATRKRIGDALAERWKSQTAPSGVGKLIADGFVHPMSESVRQRLENGEGLHEGGAEIIVAAEDDSLTESVLRAVCAVGFPGHVTAWQVAIDRIAARAASIYLERARQTITKFPEREVMWLAYLLSKLATAPTFDDPRMRAAVDPDMNPLIRLAALVRLRKLGEGSDEKLVSNALTDFWKHELPHPSPVFDLICNAMWELPDPVSAWRRELRRIESVELHTSPRDWWLHEMSPQEAYWRPLMCSIADKTPAEAAVRCLRELEREERLAGGRLHATWLTRAFLGDSDAFAAVTEHLPNLRRSDIVAWLQLVGRHSYDVVAKGILRLISVERAARLELSHMLAFVLTHELEVRNPWSGSSGRARRLHAAAGEGGRVLRAWADEAATGS
ncbi:NACHT domain-containing protein [Polyangium spumosum]|uniref:NACHT domain-containing protein n=1 Tax=Polyangium spumosum TaxID=889282 RepID=A0A6N7QBD9_9BACT|nr:NACHT domain-containing protein [Polyangium spumosum]MRG98171.1 NACHT domain-containing protein [Polyangium spumosum]